MTEHEVSEALDMALEEFMRLDLTLLRDNVNERSITHKLAEYLEKRFRGYDVDCEYNRNQGEVKKIQHFPETVGTDDTNATTVFPDIIVHQRGKPEGIGNLLVIEVKKSASSEKEKQRDRIKLKAYKRDPRLKYEYAVFLEFRTGDQPERNFCFVK